MPGIPGVYIYNDKGEIVGATGGKKAAVTNKKRYGKGFYVRIGALGGRKSTGGGFAANPELAREAGRKGGMVTKAQREKSRSNAR